MKIVLSVLVLVVALALAACGGTPTAAPNVAAVLATLTVAAQPTAAVVAPTSAPPRTAPTATNTASPDPASLAGTAGTLCDKAFSGPVPALQNLSAPESPILTMLNKEYQGRAWNYNLITKIRFATDAANIRSLLCIVETRKQTDKYDNGAPLYQRIWEARFLRWPDGQILRATPAPFMAGGTINKLFPVPAGAEFYADPPEDKLIEFVKLATGG